MKKIYSLSIATFLSIIVFAQQFNLDFGTATGTIMCITPYTGTTAYCSQDIIVPHPSSYSLRFISSNWYQRGPLPAKCQFDIKNPGDPTIGTGSEVQFIQDDLPDLRLQVADFVALSMFKISFKIKINKPTSQHWSYPSMMFYFGDKQSRFFDKTKTPSFANSYHPHDTAVFGSIYFRADGLLPNFVNAIDLMYGPSPISLSIYSPLGVCTMTQGTTHRVEVYANTSNDSIVYRSPQGMKTLAKKTYHVYVDSVLVHIPMKNLYYRGGAISAFSWFVNQPNYFSPIIIDDVEWSNDFMISSLPVELSRFDVSVCRSEASRVCLSWRTELELNNDYFVVERSMDGVWFDPVCTVEGNGTTTSPREYIYEDRYAALGTFYYRLKQVDFDGVFAYSPIQAVSRSGEHPVCDIGAILKTNDHPYTIYDMVGREIVKAHSGVDMSMLHGLYIVAIVEGDEVVCREKVWLPYPTIHI